VHYREAAPAPLRAEAGWVATGCSDRPSHDGLKIHTHHWKEEQLGILQQKFAPEMKTKKLTTNYVGREEHHLFENSLCPSKLLVSKSTKQCCNQGHCSWSINSSFCFPALIKKHIGSQKSQMVRSL
jgi:hypothetical protein